MSVRNAEKTEENDQAPTPRPDTHTHTQHSHTHTYTLRNPQQQGQKKRRKSCCCCFFWELRKNKGRAHTMARLCCAECRDRLASRRRRRTKVPPQEPTQVRRSRILCFFYKVYSQAVYNIADNLIEFQIQPKRIGGGKKYKKLIKINFVGFFFLPAGIESKYHVNPAQSVGGWKMRSKSVRGRLRKHVDTRWWCARLCWLPSSWTSLASARADAKHLAQLDELLLLLLTVPIDLTDINMYQRAHILFFIHVGDVIGKILDTTLWLRMETTTI